MNRFHKIIGSVVLAIAIGAPIGVWQSGVVGGGGGGGQQANIWVSPNGVNTAVNCVWSLTPVTNPDPTGVTDCGPTTPGAAGTSGAWNQGYLKTPNGTTNGIIGVVAGTYPDQKLAFNAGINNPTVVFQTDTANTTKVGNWCPGGGTNCPNPNFVPLTGLDIFGPSNISINGSKTTLLMGLLDIRTDGTHNPSNISLDGFATNYSQWNKVTNLTLNHGDFGNITKLDQKNPNCAGNGITTGDGTNAGTAQCPTQGLVDGAGFYWCPDTGTAGNGSMGTQALLNVGDNIQITSGGATNLLIENSNLENFVKPPSGKDPVTGCSVDAHIAALYVNGNITTFDYKGNVCSNQAYACIENDFHIAGKPNVCDGGTWENNWFPALSQAIFIKIGNSGDVCQNLTIRNNSFAAGVGTIYYLPNVPTPAGTWVNDQFYNNVSAAHNSCVSYGGSPGTFNATSMAGWTWKYNYQTSGSECPTATNDITNAAVPYVNLGAFDLHEADGSLTINAGDPSNFPALDIDGITRPQGSGPDMGASER